MRDKWEQGREAEHYRERNGLPQNQMNADVCVSALAAVSAVCYCTA